MMLLQMNVASKIVCNLRCDVGIIVRDVLVIVEFNHIFTWLRAERTEELSRRSGEADEASNSQQSHVYHFILSSRVLIEPFQNLRLISGSCM